jgi:acyl-CoA synthetase (AMP-forming)/AMP-acid ligase II/thioesterase domain-containing protein/acyl carrier protein
MYQDTIRQLLDASAERYANKTALIFPDSGQSLSYAQLQQRVQAIISGLSTRGLEKGSKIAIHLPNGQAFVETFLAAMYAGFVAVPLDYQSGQESLNSILKHCNANLLVTDITADASVIPVVRARDLSGQTVPDNLSDLTPNDHALIDYTSGTTGNPKGVLLGHSQLIANARVHEKMHTLSADDITMLVMPLHHLNPQGVSLLSTIYTGGTVIIPDGFRLRDFAGLICRYSCTWVALVPAMIEQLLAYLEKSDQQDWELNELRFVRCSSAPLSATAQKKFEQRFTVPVIQAMGSTEAGATFFSNPLPPEERKAGSVGLPVGFKARVVNENGDALAHNEVGAIQVLGNTLMLSYYQNEEASNQMFSDDGWMFTGDAGYCDDDGYYFISGRRAELVNRGGEKILLSEVDSILLDHLQVLEAAAVAVPDDVYGQQLAAFVVLKDKEHFVESDLLLYCRERLGEIRAPTRIFEIDTLPRTSTMKVRRGELSQIAEIELRNQLKVIHNNFEEGNEEKLTGLPANLTERLIADMFARVLNIEPTEITRDGNFFELGGTSLAATRFLVMLGERNLGDLQIQQLFEHPTVKEIAKYIESARSGESTDDSALVCLSSGGDEPPLFFVPGGGGDDNAIFFLYGRLVDHMDGDTPIYAFRAHGVKGEGGQLHSDIGNIASEYINAMKQKQPTGPYKIAGFCIGGLVAYEMAQQLVQEGNEVASLVLADTRYPGTERMIDRYNEKATQMKKRAKKFDSFIGRKLWQRAIFHLQTLKELPVQERSEYFINKLGLLRAFYLHSTRTYTHTHTDLGVAKKIDRAKKHYQQVLAKYVPEPYPGKFSVIVSDNLLQRERPWRDINPGRVHTYTVPGDHESHVTQYAKEVAITLTECLHSD